MNNKQQTILGLPSIVFPLLLLPAWVNAQVDMPAFDQSPEMQEAVRMEQIREFEDVMSRMDTFRVPNPDQTQNMFDNLWSMGGGNITRGRYMPDVEPARDEFFTEFGNMLAHLSEARQDQALQSLEILYSFPDPNEYETALMAVGEVSLIPKESDPQNFLYKLQMLHRHSTSTDGVPLFPEEFLAPYLRVGFMVAVELKYYAEALNFHETLRDMKDRSLVRDLASTYRQVVAISNDESTYGVRAMLGDTGEWELQLFKTSFYLDEVEGVLHGFEMLCGDRKASLQTEELISYSVPQGLTGCQARVVGDAGTRFALVQF